MLLTLLYALAPVAAGGALASFSGREKGWMGPLRTLAITAALALVLVELLPAAAVVLGAKALIAFAVGFLLPMLAEYIGENVLIPAYPAGLELAFFGLLGHQIVDGLQIGAAEELTEGGLVVALTIAAHSAPLVATAVFGYVSRLGVAVARRRVWWLALATTVGVLLGHLSGVGWAAPVTPWIQASMSGLLLHILSHDLSTNPPQSALDRTLDLLAALAGLGLPVLLLTVADGHVGHSHLGFLPVLVDLARLTGPLLLVVLTAAVLVLQRRTSLRSALDAVVQKLGPWILAGLLLGAWSMTWLPGGEALWHSLPHVDGLIATTAVAALMVVLMRGLWQTGTRRWFQALIGSSHGHDHEGHHHAHHHAEHAAGREDD